MYAVRSKSFRPDQLFKVTEIKQICYFSTQSPFISTHFSTDTLTSPQTALYIPHRIFHLARLLYVRPETFGPYYVVLQLGYTQFPLTVLCRATSYDSMKQTSHFKRYFLNILSSVHKQLHTETWALYVPSECLTYCCTLTFWRRIFFFQILAHPVFKM